MLITRGESAHLQHIVQYERVLEFSVILEQLDIVLTHFVIEA